MTTACIVGFGRMGQVHLTGATKLGVEVVAVVDQSVGSLRETYPHVDFFSSVQESPSVDLTIVSTTTNARNGVVTDLLKSSSSFVLLEKPIASSVIGLQSLIDQTNSSKIKFAVNHQMRFMPHSQWLKENFENESFGPLGEINVVGSNFGLAMNGSHFIEFFRWLLGDSIMSVSADLSLQKNRNPRGAGFRDYEGLITAKTHTGIDIRLSLREKHGHGIYTIYSFRNAKVMVNELTGLINVDSRKAVDFSQPTTRYGLPGSLFAISKPLPSLEDLSCSLLSNLLAAKEVPALHDGAYALQVIFSAILSSQRASSWIPVSEWYQLEGDQLFA
jgi:hypothetical protein